MLLALAHLSVRVRVLVRVPVDQRPATTGGQGSTDRPSLSLPVVRAEQEASCLLRCQLKTRLQSPQVNRVVRPPRKVRHSSRAVHGTVALSLSIFSLFLIIVITYYCHRAAVIIAMCSAYD